MGFDLQPRAIDVGTTPPVRFSFDQETENFGGPDGEMISRFVDEIFRSGSIQIIPCYSHSFGERLTLKDLGAIPLPFWDLQGYDFPAIEIPEDPDMPEGAVF
ncbi:MAG: hypothetical protein HQL85_09405 [Magnetococcales bacterium]|nr:hypothetical protein [Magnetococcales bacterium]MBF0629560.1 hypothetical protein [Magnetococcales bacterium]